MPQRATLKVPTTSGTTPKACAGAHSVFEKKSANGTSRKKSTAGISNETTIAIVVAIERTAQPARKGLIAFSP